MHKHTFLTALFSFLFFLCQAQLQSEKIAAIEQLVTREMSRQQIPGLSIAVAVNGALAWSGGYGLADVENYVPAKATTRYRTASVGKPITATAVLQLIEQGRIDPDAPIQQYCPEFPAKRWPVTTRHLLAHQSGIRHYDENNLEEELYSTKHYPNVTAALAIFKEDTLLFPPGSDFQYSTYGYTVLGCVIEGAGGLPFMEYMTRHVFQPAGMRHTVADDPRAIIPERARGYARTPEGELRNSRMVDMSNKLPAGGYLTTAEDLVRFCMAQLNGSLLQPKTFGQMISYQKLANGDVLPMGLGWALSEPDDPFLGEREVFHGGRTPQVSAVVLLLPEHRFAVAILANLEGVESRMEMAEEVARIVVEGR